MYVFIDSVATRHLHSIVDETEVQSEAAGVRTAHSGDHGANPSV